MRITNQVKGQFASVQLTFVSVLIGLILADLVTKLRADVLPLPITLKSLIYWGEALGILACSIGTFTLFSIAAITAGRTPTMALSLITLLAPLILLIANSFVGDPLIWRYLLSASAFLISAVFVTGSVIGAQAREPGFEAMAKMAGWAPSRLVLMACVALYLAGSLLGLARLLPDLLALVLAWGAAPASLLYQHFLYREWHKALVEIDAALGERS